MSGVIDQLLARYPLVSDQVDKRELGVILRELEQALGRDPSGTVVEFGCYLGTTSLFIRRCMDTMGHAGEFHVYDSFEGLPEKSSLDASPTGVQFIPGALKATKKEFEMQFKKAGLATPKIHKGWFSDLASADVQEGVVFAYLDGDYYESIQDSLRLLSTKLHPSAIVVVDDYANEALPGAARAVDEWVSGRSATMRVEQSLAIIRL